MTKYLLIRLFIFSPALFFASFSYGQLSWQNVDSLYQPLPSSVHVYYTNSPVDTGAFRAFYLIADLKDKKLDFTADTTYQRRLTPSKFYDKNNQPLVVVNSTFFSFETNRNLNVVIKNKKLVSYNIHTVPGKGKDTLTYRHPFGSAIGITKKGKADIAWLFSDSSLHMPYAIQCCPQLIKDSIINFPEKTATKWEYHGETLAQTKVAVFSKWKMKTAVGGGPVLIQNGGVDITNNEELKFAGKAINDKHPRTAMGYTKDNKLIILVTEGRNPGIADGATLAQEAEILKNLGCREALNLDGGGSSCLLINGKETIKVSDKTGQRPVPAVFIIKEK